MKRLICSSCTLKHFGLRLQKSFDLRDTATEMAGDWNCEDYKDCRGCGYYHR